MSDEGDDRDRAFTHVTVLRDEVVRAMADRGDGVFLDVTLGGGGHTEALLQAYPRCRVIGVDRDAIAREAATKRLSAYEGRVTVLEGTMADARSLLDRLEISTVDGVVADIGVSSPQIDDPARGMSFRSDGPLDMRMDRSQDVTAYDLLRGWTEKELADTIYQWGDERASRPIAKSIKRAISEGSMESTGDLAKAVYRVLGPPRPGRGIDPATRTFQALRIAVNDELGQLESLLAALPTLLADDGIAAIISFHSLEDRLVKHSFRDSETMQVVTKKPLEAGAQEQHDNARSRSAKLRVARRIAREISE